MASRIRLDVGEGWLEYNLSGFEFPDETSGADANWISGQITLEHPSVGDRPRSVEIFFRTDEIGELSDQLTELLDGRARQVSTLHIEQMFGLTIEPDGDGFLVDFWIDDHQGWAPSIKGSRATRASLESFCSQVNEATGEFPVRGEPL